MTFILNYQTLILSFKNKTDLLDDLEQARNTLLQIKSTTSIPSTVSRLLEVQGNIFSSWLSDWNKRLGEDKLPAVLERVKRKHRLH